MHNVKNKHEPHHANNENQGVTDISPEQLSSSTTKINVEMNEPSTSANFSLTPQVNNVMEGKNTPLGSGDSEEVLNEEHDVYAEQSECIKEIMSSYDDTDSEDDQISSESEDEISVDIEQVAAEMKNKLGLSCANLS